MNFYHNNSSDLFTAAYPDNRLGKVIQFPLIRLVILLIFLFPVQFFTLTLENVFNQIFDLPVELYANYFIDILTIVLLFLAYNGYTQAVENRKAHELSFYKFHYELGAGILIAFLIVAIVVSILAVLGFYKIDELNPFGNVVYMFFDQMRVGFVEELLFRVIIFKLVEEFAGSWIAVAVQGILFGFAHATNPNATLFTSLTLVIFFSILFGAGFMMTRRIWFVMGFHWSWNFFQAGIFGMQNSGWEQPSLISPVITGPDWLTGGDWGIEISVLAMVMLFVVGLFFLKTAIIKKQVVKPLWAR